jgi:hypothetical protein
MMRANHQHRPPPPKSSVVDIVAVNEKGEQEQESWRRCGSSW